MVLICFLVCSSVLYLQKSSRTSISVSDLLIFCVFMLFFCFSLPAKKIRGHSSNIVVDSPPYKNGEGIFPLIGGKSSTLLTHISATAANYEAYQQKLFRSVAIMIVETTNSGGRRQNIKGALKIFREAKAF